MAGGMIGDRSQGLFELDIQKSGSVSKIEVLERVENSFSNTLKVGIIGKHQR